MDEKKNEIILFENEGLKLEVNMQDETVWLSLDQMAELFKRDKSVISRHIRNIFAEEELERNAVVANFATTATDGKVYQVDYYSLDVIISVGYRVKSKEGTKFRIWANKILKDHMLKGYTVNQRRLEYLEKTIKLIDIATRLDEDMRSDESYNMLKVIADYTKALDTLDKYDHHQIKKPNGTKSNEIIKYEDCLEVINKMSFKESSEIFGRERDQGLESVIRNVYQEFGGQALYQSIEEKACNFLYFIVKDHIFVDGNKRIGATLFLYFLNFYGLLRREGKNIIEPETLVAVTLFVAQSNPKEKDVVIDLLMNILVGM